jgi:predicted DCC family thiol-disulfide oxidoreductase YuxK
MLDVVYDGECSFCRRSLRWFDRVDVWRRVRPHDMTNRERVHRAFPELIGADLDDAMFVVTAGRRVYRGFFAVRRLLWNSPMTWLLLPLFYLPGASAIGRRVYAWVARNRRRFGCESTVCDPPPLRHHDR